MSTDDPADEAARRELRPLLHEEVQRLPAKYRTPLVLCHLQGLSNEEAARQLGCPLGTVKIRLTRARDLLRKRLARRGLTLAAAALVPGLAEPATAAVPTGLMHSTIQAAMRFAAGETTAAGSVTAAALAEGVCYTMMLSRWKVIAAVVLALTLVGGGGGLLFRLDGSSDNLLAVPVDPPPIDGKPDPRVVPGAVAISKPDKLGLVTMLRPMVSRLSEKDPPTVALHWATEKGPIPHPERPEDPPKEGGTLHTLTVKWLETFSTLTVRITTPDGQKYEVRPVIDWAKQPNQPGRLLYWSPTAFLTLYSDGLVVKHNAVGLGEGKLPWVGDQKVPLEAAGVYTIQVAGSLVFDKQPAAPFTSGEVAVELGSKRLPAETKAAALKELEKKDPKAPKDVTIIEDAAGNRLCLVVVVVVVVVVMPAPRQWSQLECRVVVKPDGTVSGVREETVFTCVAAGTLVEGERGPVAIEQIRIGDRVWGYDLDSRRKVLVTVQAVWPGTARETLVWGGLRVTGEHPLLASGTWKRAAAVLPEDRFLTTDGREVVAGEPECRSEAIAVYDLTVDGPHNFLAGGFLVHNKRRLYDPMLHDPWYRLWPPPEKEKR